MYVFLGVAGLIAATFGALDLFYKTPNRVTEVVYVDGLNEIDSTAAWVYLDLVTGELILNEFGGTYEGNYNPENELETLGVL